MEALIRWYHTVRPLKAVQWWYLLMRPLMLSLAKRRKHSRENIAAALATPSIRLCRLNANHCFDPGRQEFDFLNQVVAFPDRIEWDYRGAGMLWAYNLNYFEWLYDDTLSVEDRFGTLKDFVANNASQSMAMQAYPIALRVVAWIRFLLRFGIKDETVIGRLYDDCLWLCRFPEHHLQGNHLWENSVALVCAGVYFRDENFYRKGSRLLTRCLAEQVLPDGGHLEGSPMYHSLLLWRLMQCLELMQVLSLKQDGLDKVIERAAIKMLGWIQQMTFSDGSWPMFNDSAAGIAPDTKELLRYAGVLELAAILQPLNESGYRMIRSGEFELAVDIAPIQPDYQPGHAHADIGSFCLHYRGKPVIVDTGISTYEVSDTRLRERGTNAHNTLAVGGRNSSELWKSFRVGRRFTALSLVESPTSITIKYSPWSFPDVTHTRTLSWNDNCITVEDRIFGEAASDTKAFLHFHPGTEIAQMDQFSFHSGGLDIHVSGAQAVSLDSYQFAYGFNQLSKGRCACFGVREHLITSFCEKTFT